MDNINLKYSFENNWLQDKWVPSLRIYLVEYTNQGDITHSEIMISLEELKERLTLG